MGSDGAIGMVLASGAKARALGLHVIAKLQGYADANQVYWIHQLATTF
jgi:acetyl-CoA acetyltransferase